MLLGIVLNIAAAIGSFIFGYIEDKVGAKKVINLTLLVLVIATLLAYYAPESNSPKTFFWTAGVLIGLMVGPNQSCSRSLMAQLAPKENKMSFLASLHLQVRLLF